MSTIRRDHGRRSTTEYASDDCGNTDNDDGDGKPSAVRQRRSVEMHDGWMTESDVDDSEDDKNSSEIGLRHTGAKEQQPKQRRASPSSSHSSMTGVKCNAENRPASREDDYAFGGSERTDDDRQTDDKRTEDRNVLGHISPLTFGFGDDCFQVPPGKLAYPKRRTSGYGSMLPTRLKFGQDDLGTGRSVARPGEMARQTGSASVRDSNGKRWKVTDQESVSSISSPSTTRSRVVTRSSGGRDGTPLSEGNKVENEQLGRTLPGRGRGRGRRKVVGDDDRGEDAQHVGEPRRPGGTQQLDEREKRPADSTVRGSPPSLYTVRAAMTGTTDGWPIRPSEIGTKRVIATRLIGGRRS